MNATFGGQWTEEKLDILEGYLDAYTTVLKNQPFSLVYLDAFAGEGLWSPRVGYSSDEYGEFIEVHTGSTASSTGSSSWRRTGSAPRLCAVEWATIRIEQSRSLKATPIV